MIRIIVACLILFSCVSCNMFIVADGIDDVIDKFSKDKDEIVYDGFDPKFEVTDSEGKIVK